VEVEEIVEAGLDGGVFMLLLFEDIVINFLR
jgi:hypothetical protein